MLRNKLSWRQEKILSNLLAGSSDSEGIPLDTPEQRAAVRAAVIGLAEDRLIVQVVGAWYLSVEGWCVAAWLEKRSRLDALSN